jgi:hypothetical protein
MVNGSGIMLFWPVQKWVSYFKIKDDRDKNRDDINYLRFQVRTWLFDAAGGLIWLSYLYVNGIIIIS